MPSKEKPKIVVECDGCTEKFDASDYDNIRTRHPHYNFAIETLLNRRGGYDPLRRNEK